MLKAFLICAALVTSSDGKAVAKADLKSAPLALESEAGDISGYYTCKGMEVGGKSYSGVATISRKGDVYVVQWVIGSGSTFTGIGIRQGNMLSASWAIPGERGVVRGVNVYRIESSSGAFLASPAVGPQCPVLASCKAKLSPSLSKWKMKNEFLLLIILVLPSPSRTVFYA